MMRNIIAAIALYFGIVFGAGFLLGPIRVFWLEPSVGPLPAVLVEMPVLLVAMVVAARWSPRKAGMSTSMRALALMGLGALTLVLAADFSVGRWLRGLSPEEQLRHFSTPEGIVYAASLVLFAAMPVIVHALGPRR